MIKRCLTVVVLALSLSWAPSAQDAKGVIADVSKAMGAEQVKTIQYSGPGTEFSFGQAYNPTSPWPGYKNKTYTRTIDFEGRALRVERVAEPLDRQRRGGGLPAAAAQTVVLNANTAPVQQLAILLSPYAFLKAAQANNATATSQTVGGKKFTVLSYTGQNKAKVNAYVDDQHLVARVETWADTPMMGDTLIEAAYSDYKDFGGVKVPTTIVEKQGGYPTLDLTVSDVKINEPANIRPPQGGGGAPGGEGSGENSRKLGDGVYVIFPAHAAIVVDFKDYIVVIEGPQSEARATAIIDEAKRLIPGKPIKYVVNTHPHFDHAGGLRTFAAEGATIITHQINKPYLEKLLALPHTLNPDKLSASKNKVTIETMTEKKVLTDGNHVIELHHLTNILHNEAQIMAYFPKEKVLLEADAWLPPATAEAPDVLQPSHINPNQLLEAIARLKLDVETIVPVHYPADRRVVTLAELTRRAAAQAAAAGSR